jgi:RNA polymerase sigma factor (sigma-70 family)
LDDLLNRLATLNPRHARVVELRFFGGLSVQETAHALEVSPATVKNDWRAARAWLLSQLSDDDSGRI